MSMPNFDYRKAKFEIDNGPALDTRDITLGKRVITVEKVATIWHLQRPNVPDFVFRLSLDGVPVSNKFGRVFYHPCSDFYRQMNTRRKIIIQNIRPDWVPEGVTLNVADKALDNAMQDMLAPPMSNKDQHDMVGAALDVLNNLPKN